MIRILSVCVLLAAVLAGCSSTESALTADPAPAAEPEARPYDLFAQRGGRLYMNPGKTGADVHVGAGGTPVMVSSSPAGNAWAFALARADSSRLYVFDGTSGRVSLVHSGAANLLYTGAWAAEGARFVFGFRSPGWEGDIRSVALGSGGVERVGCVSAKEVIARRADGSLVVRARDNIYLVENPGCATLETLDARKMHHIAASPSGDMLAYVLRDLVYNREDRSYEPDSSLYIRDWTDREPIRIIGDRYSPRYPAWSPDGSELAYDVRLPDAPGTRSVSIYTLETGQSSYLIPPAEGAPSRMKPIWSPRGDHLIFGIQGEDGSGLRYRPFAESFTRAVAVDRIGGSIDLIAWAGPHHLFVRAADGRALLFDLESGTVVESGDDLVLAVWTD